MKFWNKDMNLRRTGSVAKPPHRSRVEEAKQWCLHYPSKGLFYFHYTNTRWWLEFEADALMFALKFSR